jgi:hypothetical protein
MSSATCDEGHTHREHPPTVWLEECARCRGQVAVIEVSWVDGQGWLCQECREPRPAGWSNYIERIELELHAPGGLLDQEEM